MEHLIIKKFGGYLIRDNSGNAHLAHYHDLESELNPSDYGVFCPHCDISECEKYFPRNTELPSMDRPLPKPGEKWRHFKTGKLVEIIALSQDTEFVGFWSVVYRGHDGRVWNRPLDMFMSEVDRNKYPDREKYPQRYRLEKMEDSNDS